MKRLMNLPALIGSCLVLMAIAASAESLLKNHPLQGQVKTTYWTFLASQNPYRIPDSPSTMTGTMTVASPGYGAGMGLYSWTGNYSMTVNQASTATPSFRIQQVVYQLDVTWDPAVPFPFSGGPKLSYNGGNQLIPATLPMIADGTRIVDNQTGIPEMEGIDSFAYRGITWQWDLSGAVENITSVKIQMPFANHTSVVGARVDVASEFVEIGAPETPLQAWRRTHFGSAGNEGPSADIADSDGDGLPNLIEYALGTIPTSPGQGNGSAMAPKPLFASGRLKLAFSLPEPAPSDLIYRVRVSNDMVNWSTLATKAGAAGWTWQGEGGSQVSAVAGAGRVLVEVADDRIAGDAPRMMRLEVSY
ncbi:hypothetical protein [Luteolibacter luteus]|uniref:Uncharacterized protein n=1 Tax=Luteolibacter luteus TaxID=2728835 RepID=A0A858RLT5_9BACT|nr:hypothetical protein [Luteolibacter luteus]QJE97685.1 hypothetical protein HHL09_18495 [Luteolibacter luteus]